MSDSSYQSLEPLFHPRSIALVGITVDNPDHWTRTFLDGLLAFNFEGPLYLVNPKGGEIRGLKVYQSLSEVHAHLDYVIGTVPARVAPAIVRECAARGVKAVHFCTAGFGETSEDDGVRIEAELAELGRTSGTRVIGPNCMGLYCPESRLSFNEGFPREIGPVGFISQSGGNASSLVKKAMWRGVRFSKVISYGNGCDLNESDFLEHLADDPATEIVALYVEGVKDGPRFRQALDKATRRKPVVLLKGGITEGGATAALGHTGSLAGSAASWDALCRQLGIIRVNNLDEMVDVLVTLVRMPIPRGRKALLLGSGGGASVQIADDFEKKDISVPPLPQYLRDEIRQFTPIQGNILRNPIDYSQTILEADKLLKTVDILSHWEGSDFLVGYLSSSWAPPKGRAFASMMAQKMLEAIKFWPKPAAIVVEPSTVPEEAENIFPVIQAFVSAGLPVYLSFAAAANAINLVLNHANNRHGHLLAQGSSWQVLTQKTDGRVLSTALVEQHPLTDASPTMVVPPQRRKPPR